MAMILLGNNADHPELDVQIFHNTVAQYLRLLDLELGRKVSGDAAALDNAAKQIPGFITQDKLKAVFGETHDAVRLRTIAALTPMVLDSIRHFYEPVIRKDKPSPDDIAVYFRELTAEFITADMSEDKLLRLTDALDVNVVAAQKRPWAEQTEMTRRAAHIVTVLNEVTAQANRQQAMLQMSFPDASGRDSFWAGFNDVFDLTATLSAQLAPPEAKGAEGGKVIQLRKG